MEITAQPGLTGRGSFATQHRLEIAVYLAEKSLLEQVPLGADFPHGLQITAVMAELTALTTCEQEVINLVQKVATELAQLITKTLPQRPADFLQTGCVAALDINQSGV